MDPWASIKIPHAWECVDCGKEFVNEPGGSFPVGHRTKMVKGKDGDWFRVVVGDVCGPCIRGTGHGSKHE